MPTPTLASELSSLWKKSDTLVRRLPTPKFGNHNHPPTSLSNFWKRSEKLSPINSDSKGVLSRSRIRQDDGIHENLRYTQQAYVATVMKVTHATFVQFPHS